MGNDLGGEFTEVKRRLSQFTDDGAIRPTVSCQIERFKDSLEITLTRLCIDVYSWEALTTHRLLWRGKITPGSRVAEGHRMNEAQNKHMARKNKESRTVATNANHGCTICGRLFQAQIGLFSHQRTHKTYVGTAQD
jgi:hypothetical protein